MYRIFSIFIPKYSPCAGFVFLVVCFKNGMFIMDSGECNRLFASIHK
jgi:hypothetical protein